MAGWRDNLRVASFRGVEFGYHDVGSEHGRRLAGHEYPGADGKYHEDLGRKAGRITIAAYVVGDDHVERSGDLTAACEAPGPGTLIHPYWGERRVVAISCRVRFTTREGGMARLDLEFEEAGLARHPVAAPDSGAEVLGAADAATARAIETFATDFQVEGLPGWVADQAAALTRGLADLLVTPPFGSGLPMAVGGEMAIMARELADFRGTAASLVRQPLELGRRIVALFSARPGQDTYIRVAAWGDGLAAVPTATPSRRRQAANQAAIAAIARRGGLIGQARQAALRTYQTAGDAVAARDVIAARLDAEAATAADDDFRAFEDLRLAVVRHVNALAPTLPRLSGYTAPTTQPLLAIAHRLHGRDPARLIGRAEEMAVRNRLRHPGFVPAGARLEVVGHDR